jgi:hypothetical protein
MARYERAALQAAPPAATHLVLVTLLGKLGPTNLSNSDA